MTVCRTDLLFLKHEPCFLQHIKNHIGYRHLLRSAVPLAHFVWMHQQVCLHVNLFDLRGRCTS